MKTESEIGPKSNPLEVFSEWMNLAQTQSIREPTAMSVASASPTGELHARIVLCKKWSEEGFVFYTNYDSRKGHDIALNPQVNLLFYWDPLFRQIKISGTAEKGSREDSVAYWRSRPRESQLSQYISRQSQPISSRKELEDLWKKAESRFAGQEVPCPEHWGGYLVRPQKIEFWIGRPNRLHDTFEFEKTNSHWTFRRLSP